MFKRLVGGVAIAITLSACGGRGNDFYVCNNDEARRIFAQDVPDDTQQLVSDLTGMMADNVEQEVYDERIAPYAQYQRGEQDLKLDYDTGNWRKSYIYDLPGDVILSVLLVEDNNTTLSDYELWHIRATKFVNDEEYVCGYDLEQAAEAERRE